MGSLYMHGKSRSSPMSNRKGIQPRTHCYRYQDIIFDVQAVQASSGVSPCDSRPAIHQENHFPSPLDLRVLLSSHSDVS